MPNSHTQTVNPSAHLQYGSAHAREITASDIAVGVVVGRTVSFFDLFVFGIACVMVFPEVFFPFVNQTDGMFYSFAIFALGFIAQPRSEEHTSELQSLMRISYAVFCLKKKT